MPAVVAQRETPSTSHTAPARPLDHELTGPPHAPVVVALGGISATRHVTGTEIDSAPGWWEPIVGPGRAIDTTAYRVLGVDFVDAGAAPDGRPAGIVTTHDQARGLAATLDALDIDQVHALVGASYGGMVALAFAELYPDRVARLIVLGAAHETHPMSTAARTVQRRIVELALETGHASEGLALARMLAMTTYRSEREFAERFAPEPTVQGTAGARFPVEDYLEHHGARFASTWTAHRFLALSLSADLHRVDPSRITVPTTLVSFEGDRIVPAEQVAQCAAAIGPHARLVTIPTRYGHDAFLTEPARVGPVLHSAICRSIDA